MKALTCLLIAASLLATSCNTPPTLVEARSAYDTVKTGQTEQQVIARVGQWKKKDKNGHAYWRESDGPDSYVELQVDFNPSGIVTSVRISALSHSPGLDPL